MRKNKKNKVSSIILAGVLAFAFLLGGCGGSSGGESAGERAAEDVSVTASENAATEAEDDGLNTATEINILSASNYIPFIIAYEKGFFQEAFGDDVKITYAEADSGSLIMETMTADEVDLAALGDMPIVQSRVNGLDVKVISSFFTSTTGYKLIAAKDSGIQSIADLRGRTVAVMSGSTNHKLLLKYLESEGMTEDDLDVVYLKTKDQLAAFVAGSVDAAVTQESNISTIEAETGAYDVVDAEGYDTIATFVVGREEFMEQNPEYAEKFLQALLDATDWIENNMEEALQIAADYTGDTYDNMEIYYESREFGYSLNDEIQASLTDTIEYLYDQETISEKPNVSDMVDTSYLEALGVE